MSVFLAPTAGPPAKMKWLLRRYSLFVSLRGLGSSMAVLGFLGALVHFAALGFFGQTAFGLWLSENLKRFLHPNLLPVWLGLGLGGLVVAILSSYLVGRIALAGGREFLRASSDDPVERMLTKLIAQMGGANVLVRPRFRIGEKVHAFDLAAVSPHGVVFFRTQAANSSPDADLPSFQDACRRLSEKSSLPLLARPRFVQLWEPSSGPDWEIFSVQDIGRLFPRNEPGATHQEIARTFRFLYNLTLPVGFPKVPLEGPLPAVRGLPTMGEGMVISSNNALTRLGKALLWLFFLSLIAGIGFYLLQYFDYEMAERVMAPTRAVLRRTLPPPWQRRLGLGEESWIGEKYVSAFIATGARVGLSERIGVVAKDALLKPGTEWHLIQIKEHNGVEWCMIGQGGNVGWVPRTALQMKHLVAKGTPFYERPDPSFLAGMTERDEPVALLLLRVIPGPNGDVTWAKVKFLDGTISYVRDVR